MPVARRRAAAALAIAAAVFGPAPGYAADYLNRDRIVDGLVPVTGDGTTAQPKLDLKVHFALGSAELDGDSTRQLDALADALTEPALRGARIGIHGHTDASGGAQMNLKLSRQRARAVRDYLVEEAQIRAERLTVRGFGERRLRDPENPRSGVNRRVTIVNLSAGQSATGEGRGTDTPDPDDEGGGTTAITGD